MTLSKDANAELDGATQVGGVEAPEVGDISVCIECGHVTAFSEDLSLRELTNEELKEIAGNEDILAIQRARGKLIANEALTNEKQGDEG